jgi:CubicO group peptidase (beta-lactamase class C family)
MKPVTDERSNSVKFEELITIVQAAMAKFQVPGVALGLQVGEEEYTAGLGITSIENPLPVTAETLFRIGSITKTFTATALFQLVEQGRLGLDDPVRKYIPQFKISDEQTAAHVTVRQLLNHTSGWMGDFFTNTGDGDDALEKFIERMADLPQLTPLGALYTYKALREMVLDLLEMTRSCFYAQDVMLQRFVLGHNTVEDAVVVAKPWFESHCDAPCGGLSADAREMLRYARFHMGGGTTSKGERMLRAETLERMQTPDIKGEGAGWVGLNWFIEEYGGVRLIGHGGSSNGQQADLWLAPQQKTALTVLTNLDRGNALIDLANEWVWEHFLGVAKPRPVPQTLPDERLAEYTGAYLFPVIGDIFTFSIAGGGLTMTHAIGGEAEVFDTPRQPMPPIQFLSSAQDQFVATDGPFAGFILEFLRGRDGKIRWTRFGGRIFSSQGQFSTR